jgi:hypothetical protein
MLEQLLELSRKATESSVEMQNIMLKLLMQDWLSNSQTKEGISASWGGSARKRWIELTIAALNKHREAADAAYRTGIQLMEQALHVSEAKSPEDLARAMEDVWKRLFEAFKGESESQFREFQTWAERSFETVRKAETNQSSPPS